MNTTHHTHSCVHDTVSSVGANNFGMNDRIKRLRRQTFEAQPSLSIERALIETRFYRENYGKYPIPILRALNFLEICKQKTIYIGEDELIVGERGPRPKAVPTFPELTCHSVEDLHILNTRELQRYTISQEDIDTYEREVIPYWKGRTQRERIFSHVPKEWKEAYEVGMFTEFMEQRAPGHTALDGKVYQYGLLDLKKRIEGELSALDFMNDPEATDKQEELTAMSISCDAAILLAERHADLADEMSLTEKDPRRAAELRKIAEVCRWVPAHAPRTYWEAIQMYWFVHLGTITELNGWDAMNPGHFDQHLAPFYEKEIAAGTLTRDEAKELMSCFFIKVNNHTAPPKVGITAKESGTYNVAPRVGAWIETWNFRFKRLLQAGSHPVWVRGLKQIIRWVMVGRQLSHPVWVRGLKLLAFVTLGDWMPVAPRVGAWIETSTVLLLILFLEGRTPCGCVD